MSKYFLGALFHIKNTLESFFTLAPAGALPWTPSDDTREGSSISWRLSFSTFFLYSSPEYSLNIICKIGQWAITENIIDFWFQTHRESSWKTSGHARQHFWAIKYLCGQNGVLRSHYWILISGCAHSTSHWYLFCFITYQNHLRSIQLLQFGLGLRSY